MAITCPSCGSANQEDARVCATCGAQLSAPVAAPMAPPGSQAPRGTRPPGGMPAAPPVPEWPAAAQPTGRTAPWQEQEAQALQRPQRPEGRGGQQAVQPQQAPATPQQRPPAAQQPGAGPGQPPLAQQPGAPQGQHPPSPTEQPARPKHTGESPGQTQAPQGAQPRKPPPSQQHGGAGVQQAEGVDAREGEAEQAAAWSEPEAPGEGAGPRPDIEQAEQEPAPPGTTQQAYAPPPGHGWTPGYGYGVPQGHGIPQGYGAPMGMSPWYSPYQMYPYPSPFGGFFWWPFPAPYFPAPPFMMMPYGGPFPAQAPYPYPPQQYSYPGGPAPYAGGARRGRMRPLYIVLIILGTLIVIGGGVAAAVLLSGGSSNASFRLGDGSVVGSNVEFSNMVLKQNGSTITLSGTYDNAGKYEGDVIVTVQAMTSTGQSQLISFTVPVVPGTGKSFSQRQASGSLKLSGATLSSIEASSSTSGSGTGTYPFNSSGGQTSSPSGTSTLPLYQSTLPFDSSGSYPYQY